MQQGPQNGSTEIGRLRPFLANLASHVHLGEADLRGIAQLVTECRKVPQRTELVQGKQQSGEVQVILSGFACRIKTLHDRRQITSYLIPGDICDHRYLADRAPDQSVCAISAVEVAHIPVEALTDLCERQPRIMRALLRVSAIDSAIAAEWMVNLGLRTAQQRVAQLFCELYARLRVVQLAGSQAFDLPLTQAELGEALGLSTVHVNRTLQDLRRREVLTFRSGRAILHDRQKLAEIAAFDSHYLGLSDPTPNEAA
ncbi:Crp/Fnr family transcriptional regulator [Devosia pacifica]|uniref:Crp/Fnr family transcriptional regulator n=1 Tax=Devosia pacifica TaxID=1335967 RepID=A0A918RZJ5_9HYPH|nr:Crp/Fnr family transcriptional regulator [Devosia pacifica]GHA18252.1 Crp/Fnr family transcriptional regulator [Devosia pacifica]